MACGGKLQCLVSYSSISEALCIFSYSLRTDTGIGVSSRGKLQCLIANSRIVIAAGYE